MNTHNQFEHPPFVQDLALHKRPRADHAPVVRAREQTIVAKGGDADVDLDLEVGTPVVLDEQGEISGVADDIVPQSRAIVQMVDLK